MTTELLRLEYEKTSELLRSLTEIRFKLLAFVPTVAGAAVATLGGQPSAGELLGVGLVGLTATAGLVVYEFRNTEIYRAAVGRLQTLEQQLGLGGARAEPGTRIFGVRATHDLGLGLVYAAALGGWIYLVAWGALAYVELSSPRGIGALAGVVAAAAVALTLARR